MGPEQPTETVRMLLDLGFAQIPMPAAIVGRVVRAPDGGAAIGILHEHAGELGRVFLVPRTGGLLVEAFFTEPDNQAESEWRRSIFEPIAQSISTAVDRWIESTSQPPRM